jgi:hypothetical protein
MAEICRLARRVLQDSETVEAGERMLIWCEGGPSPGRAVHFPPPLEIDVAGGRYVLVDDGPPEDWHYAFVSDADIVR